MRKIPVDWNVTEQYYSMTATGRNSKEIRVCKGGKHESNGRFQFLLRTSHSREGKDWIIRPVNNYLFKAMNQNSQGEKQLLVKSGKCVKHGSKPIHHCNNSHKMFVHTRLGAKEPKKSSSLNLGRLQADKETLPCCPGPRQTGNGGEICEVIPRTTHLEGGWVVAEISFSATSAKVGEHWPALCLLQTFTDIEVRFSSYIFPPFMF